MTEQIKEKLDTILSSETSVNDKRDKILELIKDLQEEAFKAGKEMQENYNSFPTVFNKPEFKDYIKSK